MYDPEEACNDSENNQESQEAAQNQEDQWVAVDAICAATEQIKQEKVEIKEEPKDVEAVEEAKPAVSNLARTRRGPVAKSVPATPKAKRGRK